MIKIIACVKSRRGPFVARMFIYFSIFKWACGALHLKKTAFFVQQALSLVLSALNVLLSTRGGAALKKNKCIHWKTDTGHGANIWSTRVEIIIGLVIVWCDAMRYDTSLWHTGGKKNTSHICVFKKSFIHVGQLKYMKILHCQTVLIGQTSTGHSPNLVTILWRCVIKLLVFYREHAQRQSRVLTILTSVSLIECDLFTLPNSPVFIRCNFKRSHESHTH